MKPKAEKLRMFLRKTWIGPGLVVLLVYEAIQKLVHELHFPLTDIAGLCGNWVIRHARWQIPFYSGSLSWQVSIVPLLDTLVATGILLTIGLLLGCWLYHDLI